MTRTLAVALTLLAVVARSPQTAPPSPTRTLMPVPASLRVSGARVAIGASTTVALKGFADDRLRAATFRTMRRLEGRTGFTFTRELAGDPATATLLIETTSAGKTIPAIDEDESYTLETSGSQVL